MNQPSVSIIVPAYNEAGSIDTCLTALTAQEYSQIENIVVVDNGSTDNTAQAARNYAVDVYEYDEIQGSYATRNFGLKQIETDLVAFTDADCQPETDWISELVSCYTSSNADLVGGNVTFLFENMSAAAIYDASTSMNNDRLIHDRCCSVTANLLVRRSLFDEIGDFPHHLKSGGDVAWTSHATENGYTIRYCSSAVVNHPTRSLNESFKKHYRLGYGEGQKIQTATPSYKFKRIAISLLPRPIHYITTDLKHNNIGYGAKMITYLFIISWVCRLVQGKGKVDGLYDR